MKKVFLLSLLVTNILFGQTTLKTQIDNNILNQGNRGVNVAKLRSVLFSLADSIANKPTKISLGLGSVNNTSDANKPISIATQIALDAKHRFYFGNVDTGNPEFYSNFNFAVDAENGLIYKFNPANQFLPSALIIVGNFNTWGNAKYAQKNGTSSQFIKGDGSFDSNTYALTSALNSYLPLSGGVITSTNHNVLTYNSTNSNGGYTTFQNNGVTFGRVGSGYYNVSSAALNDMTIEATSGGLVLATGGFQRLKLLQNGNFGVGNISPAYKLDVTGEVRNTGNAYFATSSGNVGIGTISPSRKFHVNGDSQFDNTIYLGSQGWWNWNGGLTNTMNFVASSGKNLSFGANATYDQVVLTTAGKVGIGTTNPQDKFHLVGNIRFSFDSGNNYNAKITPTWNTSIDSKISFGISSTSTGSVVESFHVYANGTTRINGLTTSQINALPTPIEAMMVYNSDLKLYCFFNGTVWKRMDGTNM